MLKYQYKIQKIPTKMKGKRMKRIYIAHINEETGEVQTIKEHSEGMAELCEDFAVKEMKATVSTAAWLHDVGKYGERFQHRIRGDSSIRVEHSGSGAVEATKLRCV